MAREATVSRKTRETEITVELRLEGSGEAQIETGMPFFDHLLDSFARHGLFDLRVRAKGDLQVDQHHTVEDVGIVLGQALRRAIGRDIERLKSLPTADLVGMSRRLDAVIASIDTLPLGGEARAEPSAPAARGGAGDAGEALKRFGSGLWQDLKELVVVRRVGAPEPPLLPAPQAYYLRENLRLRLLNARLELVSRHHAAFVHDLQVSRNWLTRYYEREAPATREALRRDDTGLVPVQHPDGSVSIDLQGRFQSASVAHLGEDGKVIVCTDQADHALEALKGNVSGTSKPAEVQ